MYSPPQINEIPPQKRPKTFLYHSCHSMSEIVTFANGLVAREAGTAY